MHCKFLVFLLIVFFLFSFFSNACEFWFIERRGAHGKQNPDFIILFIIVVNFPTHPIMLFNSSNVRKNL